MFPTHFAPNRMGNELHARQDSTGRGPGCYDNHKLSTLVYDLQHRPECKRGYVLSARTTPRFLPPFKTITPSPQKYQQDWTQSKLCPPGKAPFSSTTLRFRDKLSMADISPGPGAYVHDTIQGHKVSWPMKFGSPDWSRVPMLERRALRTEVQICLTFQFNNIPSMHKFFLTMYVLCPCSSCVTKSLRNRGIGWHIYACSTDKNKLLSQKPCIATKPSKHVKVYNN
ncbi:protein pitchfork-like isoform X2 [Xyrauchen texanus]|uniref:protein pitchfork-like isoform X2 n=1 Tax=Xyrauchen texanus TaxID=154827 RepID=UPI0022418922|nr:protein pitchfork-like isoform X2 [Xyrauchen texanus]